MKQKFKKKKKLGLNLGIKILVSSIDSIRCLLNVDGVKLEDLETIKELVVSYYKKLLGQLPSQLYNSDIARITNFFTHKIFLQAKELLQGGVTAYEIRDTIFSMKDEAFGLYGFSALFYKRS